ncbi:MAG: 5'-methylthioadenosine/S-adenosylhomocysteine nucleosidase [Candidatus Aenigmarchaeota archaeon]|nr:5'-methylthioadenosine/S-adenosylhomocysteine nucleosidase [Candidatus Aenigmarchaeota archaeon]MBI5203919.1 5'-methylthioadenosine/S-adenosylhomocysteine nucleosidase [Nitrospirota bacterium]
MEKIVMQELLINDAKAVLSNLKLTCDGTGKFFAGLKIWIGASSHKQEIISLAQNFREAFQKLGAIILSIDKNLGPLAWSQIEDADLILMFAATPGVSARALEILFKSRAERTTAADKLYIYTPGEYASGFICGRFNAYGAKVRHLNESCFFEASSDLFLKCLYDMCEETSNQRRQKMLRDSEFEPEIGIVTALPVELSSVKNILSDFRIDPKRERNSLYQEYFHGTIESKHGGKHRIVVACCGKGNNKAAVLTTALINQYPTVEEIFMVGVAAGVPYVKDAKQHVRLGDIVVCDEIGVIQYDMVKKYTGKTEYVPPPRPPSQAWLARVENYVAMQDKKPSYLSHLDVILKIQGGVRPRTAPLKDTLWVAGNRAVRQPICPGHDPKRPRIHRGPIASSNTVLKSAKFRERLREKFKIKAVEMEASGIAEAAWQHGKGYVVIRGICDFANDDKNKVWQPYAAAAAAAFTQALIETMPVTTESKKKVGE